MGFADRSYEDGSRETGRSFGGGPFAAVLTPWVKRLLVAHFSIYLVMALGLVPPETMVDLFGFSAASILTRPWGVLTYMFVHGGFMHVLFNMLAVFFFGPPLERAMGGRAFLRYYLICGAGAALTSILLIQFIGTPIVIGASGAVFGVMLAFAWRWPDAPIYLWAILPVKAKYLVGILGLGSLWATMQAGRNGNGVAHWAHLGGRITGIVYLRYGDAIAARWNRLHGTRRASGVSGVSHSIGVRGHSKRKGSKPGGDDLDEVDRILDKIREQGMDALSSRERTFLDTMSRKYRSAPDQTA
ncbi:MAG: rhomboid family intramembrane serine protease [Gemmatimonadales bacterium]|nr:MAG: rhomboid family intramembrane serine protease [Gemmatimonadales bacterium]